MTEIEERIYQVIASSTGVQGGDIAARLGADKKVVNSTLYGSTALKALVYQDSGYRWHPIAAGNGAKSGKVSVPKPDKDLQAICRYYLNCLALEASSSVSQFLTGSYGLQYAVLNGLGVDAEYDRDAVSLLNKIGTARDARAYLGYPVRIYTIHSRKGGTYQRIAPVFLFPVEYSTGQVEVTWFPSINMEVLQTFASGSSETLANELVDLETELGMNEPDTEIEPEELVLRLKQIRQWDWAEEIDPYDIPPAASLARLSDGIYNRPIIIQAEREKYTLGLESELMTLANMPEANYRGTALHAWVKGDFSYRETEEIKPLLEVLPLNLEQAQAVETALKSDLTIVTGPPGTGKSQVVTDLLVNVAWNGKSALFSSKNNKAVDVVDARVNGLSRRPILLRIGSNQYAHRLAEIVEGLLTAMPNAESRSDKDYYLAEYNAKHTAAAKLQDRKNEIIRARNRLDELEQKYCEFRSVTEKLSDSVRTEDIGKAAPAAKAFSSAIHGAIRENNGFFARMFWSSVQAKRELAVEDAAAALNVFSNRYSLTEARASMTEQEAHQLEEEAQRLDSALAITAEYRDALKAFKKLPALEEIDKQLTENKAELASVAYRLWDKWLTSSAISFTAQERQEMMNYVAAMKLAGDVDISDNETLRKQFSNMIQKMTKYLQCWAVTSLSAKSRVPFQAGMFDYVIIDEASQCDIASILPLLYRAKHAVIIGDPKQLSHISQISRQQDLALLQKYNVPPTWSYSQMSLYALASGKVGTNHMVQLKDHFRSCADIIEFSNDVFYDGSLRTATKYAALKTPAGEKPGVRWIDVRGKTVRPPSGSATNEEEAKAVVRELKRLIDVGYQGTIGVTTPFRKQADAIRSILETREPALYQELCTRHEFIADTVHKFQGDERDIMLFSTVVTVTAASSTVGFLQSQGNLFNVAITRARAILIIIGDFSFCSQCSVSYLSRFADYCKKLSSGKSNREMKQVPDSREYPWVENPGDVSEWEKILYAALFDAGIKTIPQYPEDKYRLDLACIIPDRRKLDIEVDGAMYHRQWNGELCYRDQLRNQRMFELGWDVKRFWVYQIRDELPWCVRQIQTWVSEK